MTVADWSPNSVRMLLLIVASDGLWPGSRDGSGALLVPVTVYWMVPLTEPLLSSAAPWPLPPSSPAIRGSAKPWKLPT